MSALCTPDCQQKQKKEQQQTQETRSVTETSSGGANGRYFPNHLCNEDASATLAGGHSELTAIIQKECTIQHADFAWPVKHRRGKTENGRARSPPLSKRRRLREERTESEKREGRNGRRQERCQRSEQQRASQFSRHGSERARGRSRGHGRRSWRRRRKRRRRRVTWENPAVAGSTKPSRRTSHTSSTSTSRLKRSKQGFLGRLRRRLKLRDAENPPLRSVTNLPSRIPFSRRVVVISCQITLLSIFKAGDRDQLSSMFHDETKSFLSPLVTTLFNVSSVGEHEKSGNIADTESCIFD
eukprot:2491873-Rhodomonas_salina.1